LLPVVTLVIGAVLSFIAQEYRSRREDERRRIAELRGQRADAYRACTRVVQECAWAIARAAEGYEHPYPSADERAAGLALPDHHLVQAQYDIEVIAGDEVRNAFAEVREALKDWRDAVKGDQAGEGCRFDDPAFNQHRERFRTSSQEFREQCRAEILV